MTSVSVQYDCRFLDRRTRIVVPPVLCLIVDLVFPLCMTVGFQVGKCRCYLLVVTYALWVISISIWCGGSFLERRIWTAVLEQEDTGVVVY